MKWTVLMSARQAVVVVLALLSLFQHVQGQNQTTSVQSEGGTFVGWSSNGVDRFLGIQYARVGERFSPSEILSYPTTANTTVVNATQFGPQCVQPVLFGPPVPQSEECLYLNIWRPSDPDPTELPLSTMVWIPGGGFVVGSGSERLYDGSNLARNHGVVVVTLNYRLGALGFLVTEPSGTGGMNGIHDQINALDWLKKHVSSFGGDPNHITVFGESAGGASVCLLSVSPLASETLRRSIVQSGQCVSGRLAPRDAQVGAATTASFLNKTGADSVSELINNFTANELVEAAGMAFSFFPTIDGWVLSEQPRLLYDRNGSINPTDMIVGSNTYDDASMLGFPPGAYMARAAQFDSYIHGLFDAEYGVNASNNVLQAYSPDNYNGSDVAAFAQFNGDFFFRCGGQEMVAMSAGNIEGNAFLYTFSHLHAGDIAVASGLLQMTGIQDPEWASHTSEIPFVFGNLNRTYLGPSTVPPSATDLTLSEEMMAFWANFAKSGTPTGASSPGGWTPVTRDLSASPDQASDVPYFALKGGTSTMQSSKQKLVQCSCIPGIATLRSTTSPLPPPNAAPTFPPTGIATLRSTFPLPPPNAAPTFPPTGTASSSVVTRPGMFMVLSMILAIGL